MPTEILYSNCCRLRPVGFTLIELSIVLAILGVLLMSAAQLALVGAKQQALRETRARLSEVQTALRGFVALYGRLPCPDNDSVTDLTEFGREDIGDGVCASVEGWLPFVTLGGVGVQDAWGYRFRYRVVTALARSPNIQPTRFIRLCEGSPSAGQCGRAVADEVVAIIVSHGANGYGARSRTGYFKSAAAAGLHEKENADGRNADDSVPAPSDSARLFIHHEPRQPGGEGGEFDDMVAWMPHSVYLATLLDR